MAKHNRCTTTYEADRWDPASDPYTGWPLGSLIGGHPCFDPSKDLVLPSFRELTTFLPEESHAQNAKRGSTCDVNTYPALMEPLA